MSYSEGDKIKVIATVAEHGQDIADIEGKKGTVTSADSGYVAFRLEGTQDVYTVPEPYVEPA